MTGSLCVNKTRHKYSHWSRFLSKTFTSTFFIVQFWCSTKPLNCGWNVDVTSCLVPVISCMLLDTSFTHFLRKSFICLAKDSCLQVSSYKNFMTVGTDLSWFDFASDHFEKKSTQTVYLNSSTFSKEQRSTPVCFITFKGTGILFSSYLLDVSET